jgi:hypothetical protein
MPYRKGGWTPEEKAEAIGNVLKEAGITLHQPKQCRYCNFYKRNTRWCKSLHRTVRLSDGCLNWELRK